MNKKSHDPYNMILTLPDSFLRKQPAPTESEKFVYKKKNKSYESQIKNCPKCASETYETGGTWVRSHSLENVNVSRNEKDF